MSRLAIVVWMLLPIVATLAGRATAEEGLGLAEIQIEHALTTEFVTPHTDWARPYAGGKTRVLFFCHGTNMQPRECVELLERFDLDAKAVFWAQIVDTSHTQWHGGQTGEHRIVELLEMRWNCFALFGVRLADLPVEAQYKLLAQVADGAGLVLVGCDDPRVLKAKNRLAAPPPLLADCPSAALYTVGKGRAVRLSQRPWLGYAEGWQVEDDCWHERLGRAVLWAAAKEPGSRVELQLPLAEFSRRAGSRELGVRASGSTVGQELRLEVRVRGAFGEPLPWLEKRLPPVTAGSLRDFSPWRIPLPVLAAGKYHADARLVSSAGVESWATLPFHVASPRTVGPLNLTKDWGEIGETIAGTVTLGPAGGGETLRVQLLDRRRRELARRELRPGAGPIAFEFPVAAWMPMLVTVEAQLLDREGEISRAWQYYRVVKRSRDRFNFVIWDFPTGTLAPYAEDALARTGMSVQLSAAQPPTYAAAFDIAYIPYTTRVLAERTPEGIMRPFCWNDEAAVDQYAAHLAEKYLPSRRHGVFVYSLGDENATLGCCLSPHCAAAYRRYLQETYGSLDALNRSWQTSFARWDDVGLSKGDDNDEAAALAARNYPRWFDRQAFKSYNYVKYCQRYARAFAAIDPQAKTGFEGAGGFARGDDLDLIVRSLEFWSPYPSTADEVNRSIAPRKMPRANWMGYTKDADSLLGQYWRMVTRGMDAVWWWRWDGIGLFHGWLAPDLRPYPAVKEILDDTQIVRDGLGDLLLASAMQDDGIAVLYCYPATFACRIESGPSYGDYESAHLRLHEALRESGLQFRYVTDRMLRQGEFQAARYKVLFLIRAEALGDREADALRRFVTGGGTLIADVRPGIYDEHCRPRPHGVLDDLFQVTRTGQGKAVKAGRSGLLTDPSVAAEPAVAAGAASGDGDPPLPRMASSGRGKAILWNFSAMSLPKFSAAETSEHWAEWFARPLTQAGIAPRVRLRDAEGRRARKVETIRWQNGDAEIVALFRQGPPAPPQPVTVELACGARYVYDLRNHGFLDQRRKFTATLVANRPAWFMLTGKPVPRVRIALDRTTAQRGHVVRATVSVPEAKGLHALRIRAVADGWPLPWLDQVLLAGPEPRVLDFPIAYNDPLGSYVFRAIDLVADQTATAELKVDR